MEEYVDPKFVSLTLPGYLDQAKKPLFDPVGADDAYKNYVLRACMTLLHSTEFASYVYALDKRVTYLNRPSVADRATSVLATPLNYLASAGAAEVVGTASADAQKAQWDWDVEVMSGGPSSFSVQVSLRQPYRKQVFDVGFAGGHSDLVPLPGQAKLYFRFLDSMAVGMHWSASAFILPLLNLEAMMNACDKNGDAAGQMFGSTEPFKTFGDLWKKHVYLSYRMSGYLLALAYRIEEVRLRG
jgi:hypothetical protein